MKQKTFVMEQNNVVMTQNNVAMEWNKAAQRQKREKKPVLPKIFCLESKPAGANRLASPALRQCAQKIGQCLPAVSEFGVRGHVRALELGDMSPRRKEATCRRTPN